MFNRSRGLLGTLADLITIIQVILGPVGAAVTLAILTPTYLDPIWALPLGLKIVLSISAFFVGLAVIITIVKLILTWVSSRKPENQTIAALAFPSASESYVIEQNKQLQAQNESLKDENAQLRAERDKLKPDAERMRLRRKLKHYYGKGNHLYQQRDDSPKWKDEVEKWEGLTFIAIRMALRQEQGDFFLGEDSKLKPPSEGGVTTVSLDYLSKRLNRLHQILNQVDNLPLRPDRKQERG